MRYIYKNSVLFHTENKDEIGEPQTGRSFLVPPGHSRAAIVHLGIQCIMLIWIYFRVRQLGWEVAIIDARCS